MAASFKAGRPIDLAHANRALLRHGPSHDIIWVDKGLTIHPRSLAQVRRTNPKVLVLGYSPDNMAERAITSSYFRRGLPEYDAYITTKSFGVRELADMGARRVVYSASGYDPATHRPIRQPGEPTLEVGFVGYFEKDRARSILAIAEAGIRVDVYGLGWHRLRGPLPPTLTLHGEVLGDDYARTLCRFRIALCFLRKLSRDLHTTRSLEIPACGVFMLAEHSEEHATMFADGIEASFFRSDSELVKQTKHWLNADTDRRRIAEAGRRRVLASRCSYKERLEDALSELGIEIPRQGSAG
jgi:hypothetical protein